MAKAPKTRCSGTMTESAFWSFIRSALRKKSMFWKPIYEVKHAARRDNQSDNKRLKYEYQCSMCDDWFPEKEIEIDHIIPAGALKGAEDVAPFIERLFCESNGLRVLCEDCHRQVTNEQRNSNK